MTPRAAAAAGALLLLSACGTVAVADTPTTSTAAVTSAPVEERPTSTTLRDTITSTSFPAEAAPATDPVTWTAAKANGALDVFAAPGVSTSFRTLESHTILGTPTVMLVLRGSDEWLEVMLPGRPNGQVGWVRTEEVVRYDVTRQAVIDLETRTLQVLEGEEVIFETAVGVGSPASPTPIGRFFVTDAVRITNPHGPWGPYAFGLSARSDTVTEFNGGDGIIGVHGTNRPNSIGEAQSLGCVRLPNDVMLQLADLLSVGSPVTINA